MEPICLNKFWTIRRSIWIDEFYRNFLTLPARQLIEVNLIPLNHPTLKLSETGEGLSFLYEPAINS